MASVLLGAVVATVVSLCAEQGVARAQVWTVESAPAPVGAANSELDAVSCASSSSCMAVGTWEPATGPDQLFADRWDGSGWTLVSMPAPTSVKYQYLYLPGVSCSSPTACTAVGYWLIPSYQSCDGAGNCSTSPASAGAFAERWDGQGWTIQSVVSPSSLTKLEAVSCISASSCTAVGSSNGAALAEGWNGSSWSTQTTSLSGSAFAVAVSCVSASACTAVGDGAMSWDGQVWTHQVTPYPTPVADTVNGSSPSLTGTWCTSATACTAIGNDYTTNTTGGIYYVGDAFGEQWDGHLWHAQSIPNPAGASDSQLQGVSCATATACTAIGEYFTAPNNDSFALAAQWNGTGWTTQDLPNPTNSTVNYLSSVSCVSATRCTAVGAQSSPGSPLVEQSS